MMYFYIVWVALSVYVVMVVVALYYVCVGNLVPSVVEIVYGFKPYPIPDI